ncbi:MAG: response regulator transcription factor [Elusimicrobiota bacterium]
MNPRVFIIDDEPDMIKIATDLLQSEGYTVVSAEHPVDGIRKIQANPPDIILLDIRLPEIDGFQVCKKLKSDPKTQNIPIIMISVKADETDVVVGLEMGAEDYISKPFRKRELLARLKTVLRRNFNEPATERVHAGPITLDFSSYNVTVNNKNVVFTPKEFQLLGYFMQRKGRVLTRPVISEAIWGIEYTGSTRTIDVHVDQIRRKIGKYGEWIKSLKGIGYRFEADED